jgi:hypothetical protein
VIRHYSVCGGWATWDGSRRALRQEVMVSLVKVSGLGRPVDDLGSQAPGGALRALDSGVEAPDGAERRRRPDLGADGSFVLPQHIPYGGEDPIQFCQCALEFWFGLT